jgi:hypothetical protein
MPVHDWSRVGPGIFHDFHCAWIVEIRNVLNEGCDSYVSVPLEATYQAAWRGVPRGWRSVLESTAS